MDKSSGASGADSPQSFSFYLLTGEALAYPRGTQTPPGTPYLVQVSTTELTPEVLVRWLLQSLTPLVGEAAAKELEDLIRARGDLFAEFLEKALTYRASLK